MKARIPKPGRVLKTVDRIEIMNLMTAAWDLAMIECHGIGKKRLGRFHRCAKRIQHEYWIAWEGKMDAMCQAMAQVLASRGMAYEPRSGTKRGEVIAREHDFDVMILLLAESEAIPHSRQKCSETLIKTEEIIRYTNKTFEGDTKAVASSLRSRIESYCGAGVWMEWRDEIASA